MPQRDSTPLLGKSHWLSKFAVSIAMACSMPAGCASTVDRPKDELCHQINRFALTLQPGESKSVRLVRGGDSVFNFYKACTRDEDDPASSEFCEWLLTNSSTEFMEANVNRTLSCLQDYEIAGSISNTGVETWTGRMLLGTASNLEAEDIEVELEYAVGFVYSPDGEDFLSLTFTKIDF